MIIDVHAHVFAGAILRRNRDSDLTFMTVEEQIRRMDEKGVDMAVILPLNAAEAPAEGQSIWEVLHLQQQYPDRLIPFCDVDPRRVDLQSAADFQWVLEQYREVGCRDWGNSPRGCRSTIPVCCGSSKLARTSASPSPFTPSLPISIATV